MTSHVFNTFWHGTALPPMHWACLDSFARKGHDIRVFGYQDLDLPDGVRLEDANEIINREELFEFENSFSAFSNIFRYRLLLQRGGWWVDTDVYCNSDEIADCDYAWANQDDQAINGAILRFPPGDPVFREVLVEAEKIGNRIEIWGELGPQLLSKHLTNRHFANHFGNRQAFYAIHYLETHMFWAPGALPSLLKRTANSPFIHLWGSCFREFGIDLGLAPPEGSFLDRIYREADVLDRLPPRDPEALSATGTFIGKYVRKPWMVRRALEALGHPLDDYPS